MQFGSAGIDRLEDGVHGGTELCAHRQVGHRRAAIESGELIPSTSPRSTSPARTGAVRRRDHPDELVVLDGPRGPVSIGDGPVSLMGCVNLSRDSTYRESVATSPADAVRIGRIQAAQGAAIIDLGAESSNAKAARVSADDQIASLMPAVKGLAAEAIVSVETYEPTVVQAASAPALRSTASSTRCTPRASANEGRGCSPAARARTRSTTWWVKPCS